VINRIKHWSNAKLIKEHKALDFMVYAAECYGGPDVILTEEIPQEIVTRGLEAKIYEISA